MSNFAPQTQREWMSRIQRRLAILERRGRVTNVPVGAITLYGGASLPAGWELCDGGASSRVNDASLFAAIGTTYGVGDGSTTFNRPNIAAVGNARYMIRA